MKVGLSSPLEDINKLFLDRLMIDLSTLLLFGASVEGEFLRDK